MSNQTSRAEELAHFLEKGADGLAVLKDPEVASNVSLDTGGSQWRTAVRNFLLLPEKEQIDIRSIERVLHSKNILWEKACQLYSYVTAIRSAAMPPRVPEQVLGEIHAGIPMGKTKFALSREKLLGRDSTLLGLWKCIKDTRKENYNNIAVPGNCLKQILTCLSVWDTSLSLFAQDVHLVKLEATHLLPVIRCIEDGRLAGCTLGIEQMKALQRIVLEKSKEDSKFICGENGNILIERLIRNHAIFSIHEALTCIDNYMNIIPNKSRIEGEHFPTAPTLFFSWLITYMRRHKGNSDVYMSMLKANFQGPVWKWISHIDLNFAFRFLMNDRKFVWATNRDIPGSPNTVHKARRPTEITKSFYEDLLSLAHYCLDDEKLLKKNAKDGPNANVLEKKFSSLYFHCAIFFASLEPAHVGTWKISLQAFLKVHVPRGDWSQYTKHGRPHAEAYPLTLYIENSSRLMTSVTRPDSPFPRDVQTALFKELKSRLPIAGLFASGSVARNLAIINHWKSSLKCFQSFVLRPHTFATLNSEASSPVVACHVIRSCAFNNRWMEAIHVHNNALKFITKSLPAGPKAVPYSTNASTMIGRALLSSLVLFTHPKDLTDEPVKYVHECVSNLVKNIPCVSTEKYHEYVKQLSDRLGVNQKAGEPKAQNGAKRTETPFQEKVRQFRSFVVH